MKTSLLPLGHGLKGDQWIDTTFMDTGTPLNFAGHSLYHKECTQEYKKTLKQGSGSGSDQFRSPIWKIFTGSGSYRYFGYRYIKLNKQGKNISKIELMHIFR